MYFKFNFFLEIYLSIFLSLSLIWSNIIIGRFFFKTFLNKFIDNQFYSFLHYSIVGNLFINIILSFLIVMRMANKEFILIFCYLVLIISIVKSIFIRDIIYKKFLILYSNINKSNNFHKIILIIIIGFFLVAIAPITNADSLDYHIGVPLKILENGGFDWQPTWFHQGLSGIGENSILVSLALNAEQYGTLVQFMSLISIIGLFFTFKGINSENYKTINSLLVLLILSSPVLLFLASSPKPQLSGIAYSTLIFSFIVNNKINIAKANNYSLLLIFIIIFYSVSIKINFIVSATILLLAIIYYNIKYFKKIKIFFNFFCLSFIAFCIAYGPIIFQKYKIFGLDLISYPYPIPKYYPGFENFILFLKNYSDSTFSFPISLIVPSSPGSYSMIIGINLLISIFLLYRGKIKNAGGLILVLSICIISFFIGQKTSRFYLEAFILLNLFIYFSVKVTKKDILYLKFPVLFLSAFQFSILIFSVFSLSSGIINKDYYEYTLNKKANGYSLASWVNSKLPKESNLLVGHRSISLYNQNTFSSDWIHFIDPIKGEDKFYLDYLKNNNVEYIVITGKTAEESALFKYCDELKFGPFKSKIASRNPFNEGNEFLAWIYTSKF